MDRFSETVLYSNAIEINGGVTAGYIQHYQRTSKWWHCRQRIQNHWLSTSLVTCEVQHLFDWMPVTRHFLVHFCCV